MFGQWKSTQKRTLLPRKLSNFLTEIIFQKTYDQLLQFISFGQILVAVAKRIEFKYFSGTVEQQQKPKSVKTSTNV